MYHLAHLVSTGAGPFYDGTAHFFMTFQEILPVIALAFYSGLRTRRAARWSVLILPVAWLAGAAAATVARLQIHPAFPTLFLLLPGILLASDWKLPDRIVSAIAMIFGFAIGVQNGAAMNEAGSGLLASTGAATAAFCVAIFSSALAVSYSSGWTRIALRVAGSWLAALGLLSLGWSLR